MRFETSQAAPSDLYRRLPLRMLSFLGLMSLFVVALCMLDFRQGIGTDAAQWQANISSDSVNKEVDRETPVLKPDAGVITPAPMDTEPRGQLADWKPRDGGKTDLAADDKDLFKPRSQERTRNDRFFARRSIPSANTDEPPQAGSLVLPLNERDDLSGNDQSQVSQEPPQAASFGLPPHGRDEVLGNDHSQVPRVQQPKPALPPTSDFVFDDDRSNERNTISQNRPATSRTAPSIDDDWNPSAKSKDPVNSGFNQNDQPPREPPTFDVQTPRSKPLLDNVQQPFRSNPPDDDIFDSPRDNSTRGARTRKGEGRTQQDDGDEPSMRRRTKSRPGRDVDEDSGPIERDPFTASGGVPRRGDYRREQRPETEPFREDFTSVRIDRRYLDLVKDNTLGIRNDETEVFYWLVDHARRVSSEILDRSGDLEVQYVHLMTEPDQYRGEPITIEGDLCRLYEVDTGPNDYGVNRIYEGWVFTGDSGNHPYRIVCTGLAKGIQPAERMRKPVRVTGYFFKREGYRSNGGVHIAPTLIAHRIEINSMPNGIPLTAGIVPYATGGIMAIALALLVTIMGMAISDERSSRGGMQKLRATPHVSFAGLQFLPSISVEQSLRELAERERESTVSGAYGPLLTRQAAREHAMHDDTTSRQRQIDYDRRQFQQQTEAVRNWALRQQADQQEISALRAAGSGVHKAFAPLERPVVSTQTVSNVDELSSDRLEPARRIVPRFDSIDEPEAVRVPSVTTPAIQIPPAILPPPLPAEVLEVREPVVLNPHPAANIAYSSSKLSEWENEVERLNNRAGAKSPDEAMTSASAQIERDRLSREHETRERMARQQAEADRIRSEQLERDRIEHERLERERRVDEPLRCEPHESAHPPIDYSDLRGTTFTLKPSVANRLERERLERERLEREHHERERMEQERYEQERLDYERAAANRANTDHDHRAAS